MMKIKNKKLSQQNPKIYTFRCFCNTNKIFLHLIVYYNMLWRKYKKLSIQKRISITNHLLIKYPIQYFNS